MGTEIHLDGEELQAVRSVAARKEQADRDARRKRERAHAEARACGGFSDTWDETLSDYFTGRDGEGEK